MQKLLLGAIFIVLPVLAQAELPPLTQDPANVVSGLASPTSPALQQYQSVDDAPAIPSVPKSPLPKKSPVSTVANKQIQKQQTQLTTEVQSLESRLTQFTQSYLLAQQESKQELALLEQKSTALQAEVEQLLNVLKAMNQQLEQLKVQSSSHQQQLAQLVDSSGWQKLSAKLQPYLANTNNSLIVLILIVLLLVWVMVGRIRKRRARYAENVVRHDHDEDDTKNEYDFMGSSEGVPAQLDLARAYIAMENYEAAETVLKQVIAKGDAEQQQQARDLLSRIPGK